MLVAKEIQNNTWIMESNGDKLGLLIKRSKELLLFTHQQTASFSSIEDLEKSLASKIEFIKLNKNANKFIEEYPIKHDDFILISKEDRSYKTDENSSIQYVAGYWAIKSKDKFISVLSPKKSIFESYEHVGPFKDKFTCDSECKVKNS